MADRRPQHCHHRHNHHHRHRHRRHHRRHHRHQWVRRVHSHRVLGSLSHPSWVRAHRVIDSGVNESTLTGSRLAFVASFVLGSGPPSPQPWAQRVHSHRISSWVRCVLRLGFGPTESSTVGSTSPPPPGLVLGSLSPGPPSPRQWVRRVHSYRVLGSLSCPSKVRVHRVFDSGFDEFTPTGSCLGFVESSVLGSGQPSPRPWVRRVHSHRVLGSLSPPSLVRIHRVFDSGFDESSPTGTCLGFVESSV